jgi:hypothetical protein
VDLPRYEIRMRAPEGFIEAILMEATVPDAAAGAMETDGSDVAAVLAPLDNRVGLGTPGGGAGGGEGGASHHPVHLGFGRIKVEGDAAGRSPKPVFSKPVQQVRSNTDVDIMSAATLSPQFPTTTTLQTDSPRHTAANSPADLSRSR